MVDEMQILFEEENDRAYIVRAIELMAKLIIQMKVVLHNDGVHALQFDELILDVLEQLKGRLINVMRATIDRWFGYTMYYTLSFRISRLKNWATYLESEWENNKLELDKNKNDKNEWKIDVVWNWNECIENDAWMKIE